MNKPLLLTVTPNPAIDRTLHVPYLTVGTVHRTNQVYLVAGGKGLNVTRSAHALGGNVMVTGPLAGYSGRLVASLAREEGLVADWYEMESGETRTCLLITHDDSDATVW
jgi:fructose-1-phosphate kinase PfkB-like protein